MYILGSIKVIVSEKTISSSFPMVSYVKTMPCGVYYLRFPTNTILDIHFVKENYRNISSKFVAKWFNGLR
jgi:hypothetical protein